MILVELISGIRKFINHAQIIFSPYKHIRILCDRNYRNIIKQQDRELATGFKDIKDLIILIVPGKNSMNGGVHSIFNIARESRAHKNIHKCEVLIATVVNKKSKTYIKQDNFINNEFIFRLEQLFDFNQLERLIIHIPELYAERLSLYFSFHKRFFQKIPNVWINIMNQNIELMPPCTSIQGLFKITEEVTQTCAHHQYCNQMLSDNYATPLLLLPAFIDLSMYKMQTYYSKQNIITYSPDSHAYKDSILNELMKSFQDYKFIEIKNMSFHQYMCLVRSSKFTITFGEGFDGYFLQPITMGGISFAVYSERFFPHKDYINHDNIFVDYESMLNGIVETIKQIDEKQSYDTLNQTLRSELSKINGYTYKDYKFNLERLYMREFDYYPQ